MTSITLERSGQLDWYRRNRRRSRELFDLVDASAYYDRPIPLRHPFVFYEGHLPAFSFNTLCVRGLGQESIDPHFQQLFERGIDPGTLDDARRHERGDWPSRETVQAFGARCDERVEEALALGPSSWTYTILEHEPMHHETLLYIIHQLDRSKKRKIVTEHRDWAPPANALVDIPAGSATLGTDRNVWAFAWDNELPPHTVDVGAFSIATYPVTNADWLRFVEDGGPIPEFWFERDGEWMLRAQFDDLPLPRSWPVYVTHVQAASYAKWAGKRLPTEGEYHRAAFATPAGEERFFPWGNQTPSAEFGNFDFTRYDPEPVNAHPSGVSAWGVADLIGNGWEWTGTPFGPFAGFAPMEEYPRYSADFFDGKHFVMKGASPVTGRELIRPGFRNWFYADYPYMYAKFRCAI